jgi:hypothetical protein
MSPLLLGAPFAIVGSGQIGMLSMPEALPLVVVVTPNSLIFCGWSVDQTL